MRSARRQRSRALGRGEPRVLSLGRNRLPGEWVAPEDHGDPQCAIAHPGSRQRSGRTPCGWRRTRTSAAWPPHDRSRLDGGSAGRGKRHTPERFAATVAFVLCRRGRCDSHRREDEKNSTHIGTFWRHCAQDRPVSHRTLAIPVRERKIDLPMICCAHGLVVTSTSLAVAAYAQSARSLRPRPASDAIADALRSHAVVMIAEHHQSVPVHAFLQALIASPKVRDRVDDIVVEFANTLYQPIIDRYIRAAPYASTRCDSPGETPHSSWCGIAALRAVLRDRASPQHRTELGRPLRIIAGDPPIDWSRTGHASDTRARSASETIETFRIIEREVLAKGRRAIVIIGEEHLPRMTDTMRGAAAKPLERRRWARRSTEVTPAPHISSRRSSASGRRWVVP